MRFCSLNITNILRIFLGGLLYFDFWVIIKYPIYYFYYCIEYLLHTDNIISKSTVENTWRKDFTLNNYYYEYLVPTYLSVFCLFYELILWSTHASTYEKSCIQTSIPNGAGFNSSAGLKFFQLFLFFSLKVYQL